MGVYCGGDAVFTAARTAQGIKGRRVAGEREGSGGCFIPQDRPGAQRAFAALAKMNARSSSGFQFKPQSPTISQWTHASMDGWMAIERERERERERRGMKEMK